jgi:malonyl-CoA/methylmalonyl-CoA synthetase
MSLKADTSKAYTAKGISTPRHVGPKIFPDFATFHRLLYLSYASPDKIIIDDVGAGIQATAAQYLSDILHLRNVLFAKLRPELQQKLLTGGDVYICLMAQGGYEFSVALLAILALGAAAVPMGKFTTFPELCSASHCIMACGQPEL